MNNISDKIVFPDVKEILFSFINPIISERSSAENHSGGKLISNFLICP